MMTVLQGAVMGKTAGKGVEVVETFLKELGQPAKMQVTKKEFVFPEYNKSHMMSGGSAHMGAEEFYHAALAAGLSLDNTTLNKIVDLVNSGHSLSKAAQLVKQSVDRRMADGGSADFFFDPSSYAQAKSKEMYPKKKSEWTEQDAARHMLAAGMMAQKFGPEIAKMAGLAHEHFNAPIKTIGYALGIGKMPADYEQDLHNNALGIDLAKRAATQKELERLIKEMTSKASKTQTAGTPWIGEPKNAARLSDY
jgi:hypothetical protein